VLARALDLDFPGGRRLDPERAGSIDVQPVVPGRAMGSRAFTRSVSIARGGVRGFDRRSVRQPRKLLRSPALRESARDSQSARSRRRAVKARSRWRPDDREVVRRPPRTTAATPRARRISKRNAGGFSHGALRAVSEEGVFATGAREQTSVVEADSKHLGGASKESRKALRGANRQATGRQTARNGARRHSLRERVQWLAKAERPGRALGCCVLRTRRSFQSSSAAGPPAVDRIRGRRAGSRRR
jgi:hypothetical protein